MFKTLSSPFQATSYPTLRFTSGYYAKRLAAAACIMGQYGWSRTERKRKATHVLTFTLFIITMFLTCWQSIQGDKVRSEEEGRAVRILSSLFPRTPVDGGVSRPCDRAAAYAAV